MSKSQTPIGWGLEYRVPHAAHGKSEGEQNLTNADGMKSTAGSESDIGIDSDIGVEDGDNVLTHATKSLENEALSVRLLGQVGDMGDHVQVPTRVCYQRQRTKLERTGVSSQHWWNLISYSIARGEYEKGPDVASKSDRTRRCYKKSIASEHTPGCASLCCPAPSAPSCQENTFLVWWICNVGHWRAASGYCGWQGLTGGWRNVSRRDS
jgi:hypothetical protein